MDISFIAIAGLSVYAAIRAWRVLPEKLRPVHERFLASVANIEGRPGAKINLSVCTFKSHTFTLIFPKIRSLGALPLGESLLPIEVITFASGRSIVRFI